MSVMRLLLGELVPADPLPDQRPEAPATGLRDALGLRQKHAELLDRVERRRGRHEVASVARRERPDPLEVARDGPPPSPVVAHDLAEPSEPDRAGSFTGTHGVGAEE